MALIMRKTSKQSTWLLFCTVVCMLMFAGRPLVQSPCCYSSRLVQFTLHCAALNHGSGFCCFFFPAAG